jgi:hypothetical protein
MRQCLHVQITDSAITVRDSYKKVKEQQRAVIGKDLLGANSQNADTSVSALTAMRVSAFYLNFAIKRRRPRYLSSS